MCHYAGFLQIWLHILISKNQVLQILHLKHHACYYYLTLTTTINTPYNWPALSFLAASCLNIGYLSLHKLIRIRN